MWRRYWNRIDRNGGTRGLCPEHVVVSTGVLFVILSLSVATIDTLSEHHASSTIQYTVKVANCGVGVREEENRDYLNHCLCLI